MMSNTETKQTVFVFEGKNINTNGRDKDIRIALRRSAAFAGTYLLSLRDADGDAAVVRIPASDIRAIGEAFLKETEGKLI